MKSRPVEDLASLQTSQHRDFLAPVMGLVMAWLGVAEFMDISLAVNQTHFYWTGLQSSSPDRATISVEESGNKRKSQSSGPDGPASEVRNLSSRIDEPVEGLRRLGGQVGEIVPN